ncbi:MAG TPA: hypothetical protein VFT72_05880 [Opitutaceae bacterium]|nr:hypothetical protein [Opitutaceae bacterium]
MAFKHFIISSVVRESLLAAWLFLAASLLSLPAASAAPAAAGAAESATTSDTWSDDLLTRLLSAPENGAAMSGSAAENSGGMVLRSYQLRALKVGEAGRAANLVSILRRMLPPDSRITEDVAGNMIHVLSTSAAQDAVLELVSAMDSEPAATQRGAEETIPSAVKKALDALAETRPDASQLRAILADAVEKNQRHLDQALQTVERDANANLHRTLAISLGVAAAIVLAGGCGLLLFFRRAQKIQIAEATRREAMSLAVVPNQNMEAVLAVSREQQDRTRELQKLMESFSIAYQADRQRNSMLVEAVAKRHTELTATLEQMQQLRREIGESAGQLFLDVNRAAIDEIVQRASESLQSRAMEVGLIAESASRKMEETASRLEVQNAKAAALSAELERTQREVDVLFDKLRVAQEAARAAEHDAQEQRQIASERAVELAKREAALAGLSLLMQEPVDSILQNVAADDDGGTFLPVPNPPPDAENLPSREGELDEPPLENLKPFSPTPSNGESISCPNLPITFHITPAD